MPVRRKVAGHLSEARKEPRLACPQDATLNQERGGQPKGRALLSLAFKRQVPRDLDYSKRKGRPMFTNRPPLRGLGDLGDTRTCG
jgi:hypothetical protein